MSFMRDDDRGLEFPKKKVREWKKGRNFQGKEKGQGKLFSQKIETKKTWGKQIVSKPASVVSANNKYTYAITHKTLCTHNSSIR